MTSLQITYRLERLLLTISSMTQPDLAKLVADSTKASRVPVKVADKRVLFELARLLLRRQ